MLAVDTTMSGEQKQRRLLALGKKQGAFLCLKWAKMGSTNSRTVKVAGKSTFGEVRVVRKVGTGGIYTTNTSGKEDILGEDQVRSLHPPFTLYVMRPFARPPSSVRSRPHRAWCLRRIQLSVDCAIVLLIPAPYVLVSRHGVSDRRRLNDNAYQVRYLRGCDEVLFRRVRSCDRGRA